MIRKLGIMPYAGGDTRFIRTILKLLPKGELFVEPFGGSGVVSIACAYYGKYPRIILNDLDYYIYSIYYVVKYKPDIIDRVGKILNHWASLPKEKFHDLKREVLLPIRNMLQNGYDGPIERVGFYNLLLHYASVSPYTTGIMIRWVDNPNRYKHVGDKLRRIHKIMKKVEISNKDAFELMRELDSSETVFYVDPPHLDKNLYRLNFERRDAIELAKLMCSLQGKVLAKFSPTDKVVVDMLVNNGWRISQLLEYRRMMSANKTMTQYYFVSNY